MADQTLVQVGLSPVSVRLPAGNLENQVINNPGPSTVYLGQSGVTPATGLPFPPGSEAKLYKQGSQLFGCVAGSVTWSGAPALAATGVAMTNSSGQAVAVTVTGGTVTAIAVGATTQSVNGTNVTSGTFVVPAGSTITITYSVAPAVTWKFGQQVSLQVSPGVQSS
jgi:hypothetical protein